jgi:hypothetical protein
MHTAQSTAEYIHTPRKTCSRLMRQAMIQRQPSFYSTYFNIALCHSAVNVFLKGQIIKDVDDFFVKGIIDVFVE